MARRTGADNRQSSLYEAAARRGSLGGSPAPLADRMRPRVLREVLGQDHLLCPGRVLAETIAQDRITSMILWGPPGSGKTTLAYVISRLTRTEFVPFSAVLGGLGELRQLISEARDRLAYGGRRTTLFVDELHRFHKNQQDAFLPHVEHGTVTLVGTTTENPSFSVNAALLSRCKVFRLEALDAASLRALLTRALADTERGLGSLELEADDAALGTIVASAQGDARRALNLLESCAELLGADSDGDPPRRITVALVKRAAEERTLLYDRSGDEHYNVVSALIKSLRGSDPDAAVYWLMRMLRAGDDPLFVLRRLIIFASEDVGNADPRALAVAVDADRAFRRVGLPEGIYPVVHACLYLASCPKSNSVLRALRAAEQAVAEHGALPVPKKLRNPVTSLLREQGWGEGYRYPHDFSESHVPAEQYLPEALWGARFYQPSNQGLEKAIAERLARLRAAAKSGDDK